LKRYENHKHHKYHLHFSTYVSGVLLHGTFETRISVETDHEQPLWSTLQTISFRIKILPENV